MKRILLSSLLCTSLVLPACGEGGDASGASDSANAQAVDLLDAPIPADAKVIFVMRTLDDALTVVEKFSLIAPLTDEELAAMREEIDALTEERLGVTFTSVKGITVFGTNPKSGVILVHGLSATDIKGEQHSEIEGVAITKMAGTGEVFVAPFEGGMAIAFKDPGALRAVIEIEKKGAAKFGDSDGPLRSALKGYERGNFVVAVDASLIPESERAELTKRGIERLVFGTRGEEMVVRVEGDAEKLAEVKREIEGYVAMGVMAAKKQAEQIDGKELPEAVGMIYAKHHADALQRAFKPEVKGNGLELAMPMGGVGNPAVAAALLGILSAIAIPAFTKYTRRAKTSEARVQLAKMFDAISASIMENPNQHCPTHGPAKGTTGPTPPIAVDCNEGPGGRCIPGSAQAGGYEIGLWNESPVWNQLNFTQEQAHFFHYSFTWENMPNGGCQFSASAFGDLDGDGIFSTYERSGAGDVNGVNGAAGLFIDKDVE